MNPPARGARRVNPAAVFAAFIRRDVRIALSYRFGFASTLVQSLVSVVFVYFLGHLVGSRAASGGSVLRQGYFPFAVLGVALLGVVSAGLSAVSERLRNDQVTGTFEMLLSTATPPWLAVLSGAIYPLLYSTAIGLVTVGIAAGGFGMRLHTGPAGAGVAVAALLLTFVLFCTLGVGLASAVVLFKAGVPVVPLTTTVFTLLGGVYYPVSLLPAGVRVLSYLLPFTWSLDVIRAGLLLGQVRGLELLWLALSTAVLGPLSLGVFAAALNRSRRSGTLGQY